MPPAPKHSRRWFQISLGTMFVVVAVLAVLGVLIGYAQQTFSGNPRQIRFETEAWKRADPIENYRTVRSQMIDDLLSSTNFQGWTRPQVEGLLGKPDPWWSSFSQFDIIYVLGTERAGAYSLDDEALGFKFDSNGRVVKFGLSVN
jgi:hypothetical protein